MILTISRIVLGAILLLTGSNKFFGFFSMPAMSPDGMQFLGALAETGYMIPMIAIVEVLCGLMLFSKATTPLAALLLAPLTVNILAFHLFLAPTTLLLGGLVFLLNLYIGGKHFSYYRSIFAKIFTERVLITEKKAQATNRPVAVVN